MVHGFALGSSVASRFPRTRKSRPRQTTRPLLPSEGKEVHASRQHSRTQEWQSRPSTRSSRRTTYNGNAFGRMWHEFGHFSCFFTDSSTQESPLADILSFQMWVWLSLVQGTRIKMPETWVWMALSGPARSPGNATTFAAWWEHRPTACEKLRFRRRFSNSVTVHCHLRWMTTTEKCTMWRRARRTAHSLGQPSVLQTVQKPRLISGGHYFPFWDDAHVACLSERATVILVSCSCGTLVAAAQMFDAGKEIWMPLSVRNSGCRPRSRPLCRLLPHRHLCLAVSVLVAWVAQCLDLRPRNGPAGRTASARHRRCPKLATSLLPSWPTLRGAEHGLAQFRVSLVPHHAINEVVFLTLMSCRRW